MAWVKVESSVARHRKFQQAGPAASWLWVCGLCYCQEGLTDGFIPIEALPFLGIKSTAHLVKELVRVGLWDAREGGWQVHDYLEHNKAALEVRRVQGDRRRAGAKGGTASGDARRLTDVLSDDQVKQVLQATTEATAKQPANPSTYTATETAAATETAGAASASHAPARMASIIRPRRKDAAFEGPRVYVPQRIHTDFIGFRNHAGAERELLDWYQQVSDAWTIGDRRADPSFDSDMVRFWKARYAEQWPAVEPAKADTRKPAWLRG